MLTYFVTLKQLAHAVYRHASGLMQWVTKNAGRIAGNAMLVNPSLIGHSGRLSISIGQPSHRDRSIAPSAEMRAQELLRLVWRFVHFSSRPSISYGQSQVFLALTVALIIAVLISYGLPHTGRRCARATLAKISKVPLSKSTN